ncbi:hypothetical protein CCUS01_16370 [Colletotrichum cuscutae]|uniref:Uncharacterized protein n=1 Tax=Colletotrichum cuscutae TaxID=1209917 RepID=A0AAI9VDC6_9PEZI|nr:hypothetical protein CCUS01_16370 [Colletotrichum cuscutae]
MTASSLSASLSAHALTHPLRLPLPYSASLTQMPYEVLLLNTAGGTWGGTDSFGPEQAHGRMAKKRKAMTGSWRASSFPLSSTGTVEARRSRLGPTDTAATLLVPLTRITPPPPEPCIPLHPTTLVCLSYLTSQQPQLARISSRPVRPLIKAPNRAALHGRIPPRTVSPGRRRNKSVANVWMFALTDTQSLSPTKSQTLAAAVGQNASGSSASMLSY